MAIGVSSVCKDCKRQYERERYKSRKVADGIKVSSDGRLIVHDGPKVSLYWGEQKTKDFRRLYPKTKNEELAVIFGCSVRTIQRKAKSMELKKDEEWISTVAKDNSKIGILVNKVRQKRYEERSKVL